MDVPCEEAFGFSEVAANGVVPEDESVKELEPVDDPLISNVTNVVNGVLFTENCDTDGFIGLSNGSTSRTEIKSKGDKCRDANEWYTLSRDEVPLLFRESYVENGFRPVDKPWSFYLRSAFRLHNEFMNVWTHVIATILTVAQLCSFSAELDFINDPYTWPMLAGMLCGIALYTCSTVAHCCQSRSEFVHYIAFMIDYAGIGLYGLGSVIVHLMYCCEEDFYDAVHTFFIPLGCVLAISISCCHSVAKVRYSRPYPFARKIWQMTPIGGIYILLISPIVHRLHACYIYGIDCTESIWFHNQQISWFFLSGFFFASDIPQRFCHGKCDIFGHSHQLFHVAIAVSTLFQMHAVCIDFTTRGHIIRSRPAPTFFSSFGPVLIVIALEALCIIYFSFVVTRKLESDKAKNK